MKAKILSVVLVLVGGGISALGTECLSHYVWGEAKGTILGALTGKKEDESEEKED